MTKRFTILVVILIVLIGLGYYWSTRKNVIEDQVNTPNPVETPATTTAPQTGLQYRNDTYRFTFDLPESWRGYSVITDKWEGRNANAAGNPVVETGPIISLRNPKWTAANPYQDIPIMVFTTAEWNAMQSDAFHIGAAPINPSELGRNSDYVFALPARYNYAFPAGYQEVENILKTSPLKTF